MSSCTISLSTVVRKSSYSKRRRKKKFRGHGTMFYTIGIKLVFQSEIYKWHFQVFVSTKQLAFFAIYYLASMHAVAACKLGFV